MAEHTHTRGQIRPVKQAVEDRLLALPGVQGVDIDRKISHGEVTDELSIVVYVAEKKDPGELSEDELIPAEIDGIPTDVQEEVIELQSLLVPQEQLLSGLDTGKYTPLRGGISMGPCRGIYMEPPDVPSPGHYLTSGTLGALVRDRATGARMALTNFHVACVDDTWSVGDAMAQPSRPDGGSCPADRYGTLTRSSLSENVDGAVITLDEGVDRECRIEEIGDVQGTVAAQVGTAVRKRGRTTRLTFGQVASTDATVTVNFGDGIGTRTLKNQIRVTPDTAQNARFSDRGDSGSVVVDANNRVLGLLWAGATNGSATFLNPINHVLNELDIELCTAGSTLVTRPQICGELLTRPVVCTVTRPVSCQIVTRARDVCNIVTSPTLGCRPPITLPGPTCPPPRTFTQCPPQTLACGFDPLPRPGTMDERTAAASPPQADADQVVDDAFWLGYYTALEAMSEAEAEQEGQ